MGSVSLTFVASVGRCTSMCGIHLARICTAVWLVLFGCRILNISMFIDRLFDTPMVGTITTPFVMVLGGGAIVGMPMSCEWARGRARGRCARSGSRTPERALRLMCHWTRHASVCQTQHGAPYMFIRQLSPTERVYVKLRIWKATPHVLNCCS